MWCEDFNISAFIWASPALLLFRSDLIVFFIFSAVNGWLIAVGCEWVLFSTWVFLVNCFLKQAAIISACSFSLMVNPPVSVLIRSGIFGFWRRFLLSTEKPSKIHSCCFQFPSDGFSIFVRLALSFFGDLFSRFHFEFFGGNFSKCYRLHFWFTVSFPVVVWIAERFCHLHGSDI